jgi:hypothetical protein
MGDYSPNSATSLKDVVAAAKANESTRQQTLASLREAVQELETPHEVFWRMLVEPHAYSVVRTAIQLQLFELLHKSKSLTANDLARESGAEQLLIVRLMRVLVAMGLVKELEVQKYQNAAGGETLATDVGLRGALSFM